MKRRDFLQKTASGVFAAGIVGTELLSSSLPDLRADNTVETEKRWFKGNLHAHSQWSDGKDLPELVIDAYKKKGYDFFSLTDHNLIQNAPLRFNGFAMDFTPKNRKPFEGETSFWKRTSPKEGWPNLTNAHIQKARERFGNDSVITRETEEGLYVRMKTFDELHEQFAEKGKFLLIPGFEMTAPYVHVNLLNVRKDFYLDDSNMSKLISMSFDRATELYAEQNEPWLFTLNHPLWQYYNVQPSALIARPEIHHYELNNNSTQYPFIPEAWTPETFWDVVNAWRSTHDQELLYATGTDDSHGIFRTDYVPYVGWMYVYAKELTTEAIFKAMNRGDSYTSSGLELAEVNFDGRTLAIRIKPNKEGHYRIEFVGTKKGYDPTAKNLNIPSRADSPAHIVEAYSDQIGQTLAVVDGLEGSYTLQDCDLYVRAKAYRVGAGNVVLGSDYPIDAPLNSDAAWTQPYRRCSN